MSKVVLNTKLEIPLFRRGKVRDVYDLGDQLLIVATDRISAFDYVLPSGIPYKGKVLAGLSEFWFDYTGGVFPNHLITTQADEYPEALQAYVELLADRSMLVQKVDTIPIECVVRGYLSGSAWRSYQATGSVGGIRLPAGLVEAEELEMPIFTPTTKAETGHDEEIMIKEMERKLDLWREKRFLRGFADYSGELSLVEKLRQTSERIYCVATEYAEIRGVIIADTKFEFGIDSQGEVILIDEILTPDSSRFWPLDDYEPGRSQRSFDKQYLRDYLESIGWNKESPAPELPEDVIKVTSERYLEAYQCIVGMPLE